MPSLLPPGVPAAPALGRTLRKLAASAEKERPMTLPNLLRLHQRNATHGAADDELLFLRRLYLAMQPIDPSSGTQIRRLIAMLRD